MKAKVAIAGGIILIGALAAAGVAGYLLGHRLAGDTPADSADAASTAPAETKAVAPVQTVPLANSTITEKLTVYGTVVPRAADQQTVSATIETKVRRLLVSAGQLVQAGQDVAEVDPSPDSKLQLLQAKNAEEGATRDLAGVQERFNMKLATNQELQTSQNGLRDAKLKLEDLKARGAGESQTLKAPRAGVVAKIDVTSGQVVAAGMPVMEIDDESNVEVLLGVDPADVGRLKAEQPVDLFLIGGDAKAITGKVRLLTRRVDPATRLVDVFVALPPDTGLLLASYVRASVEVGSATGLVVPRTAVLPDDNGYSLFTVQDNHAVKHAVSIGLESDSQVQVLEEKSTLKVGDLVVVQGNYELEDGAPVSLASATTEPAATEPATTAAATTGTAHE